MSEKLLTIKCSNATTSEVSVDTFTITVLELKEKIADKLQIPSAQQRLIFKGKVLKDENSLEFYEVTEGSTIHLVKGAAKSNDGHTASPVSSTPNIPSSSSVPANNPFGVPAATGGYGNPNAFNPMMMNGFGGGAGGFGDMNSMQDQLMRNPEMMQQIMNSPMMENLMNNPEMLRNMMTSNPQMQSLLDSNPQLRHVLNDPSVLRQTMEMMRNPNAMREAVRSQDLALSQIENQPEGYNALRRMYEDIQEPMFEAQNAAAAAPPTGGNRLAPAPAPTAPNAAALPNPWGRPAAAPAAMGGAGGFGGANPYAAMMGGMGGGGAPAGGANPFAGIGGMGGLPPGMDPSQVATMMQNPQMQQMMQQMMSDPNFIQQMAGRDPQMAAAMQNPQFRAMMTNPEFLRTVSNPQNMQAMMQMQQAMQTLQQNGAMPAIGGGAGYGYGGGGASAAPGAGMDFSALLGAQGAGAAGGGYGSYMPAAAPAAVSQDPLVRFANQLEQLQNMGFSDNTANIAALTATHGNVSAAVERLLGGI